MRETNRILPNPPRRPPAASRLGLRMYMAWFTPGFRLGRAQGGR